MSNREAFIRTGIDRAINNATPQILEALLAKLSEEIGTADDPDDNLRYIARTAYERAREIINGWTQR